MELQKQIVISGIGVNSAIGLNVEQNFQSLKESSSGIESIKYLQTQHANEFLVGEVKLSNSDLLDLLDLKDDGQFTRTSLLATLAVKEAIVSANLCPDLLAQVGLVSSTTVGGMDKTENLFLKSGILPKDYLSTHPCGDTTNKVCNALGILGYRTTLSTACSSGANSIIHAVNLIKNDISDIVIAGGVDALSKFTLNGFNSLMIFDKEHCRPFDESRRFLNLGEGAGFLVLETMENALKRGHKPLCLLSGFANANDAYHQTASSPEGEGATLAMIKALENSGLTAKDISYINVHGTGTENNDMSEGVALNRVFNQDVPLFSSTKAFTGHTLGAAAGVEAVFSVLSLIKKVVFPNLNFCTPIEGLNLTPVTEFKSEIKVDHVLSNSFGFGGNNSSLIFSKI